MIDIDFYPNSIINAISSSEEINDLADGIERTTLPQHEEIDYELNRCKKDIDSNVSGISSSAKNINSELSTILNNDFDYKLNIYIQLLSKELTDNTFPIGDWIEEKKKLKESFNYNSFNIILDAIKNTEKEDIKDTLIDEYCRIIKVCLNSSIAFKHNVGGSWIGDIQNLVKDFLLDDKKIFEEFKEKKYIRENEILNITTEFSQANYWSIYSLLNNIDENREKIYSYILPMKEKEIVNFVLFLEKTDFFVKRDFKDRIQGFKKEKLRETLFLCENKELRENFFLEYLNTLEKINNRIYLPKEHKETFEHVLGELKKGHQYLTLMNKLDKKMIETKKSKI